MPLVVRPTVTVEVEGPLIANVEKSNLEEKILCAVLYIHDLSNGMSDLSYIYTWTSLYMDGTAIFDLPT